MRSSIIVRALLACVTAGYRRMFHVEPPIHFNCRCVAIPIEDLE